MRGISGVYEIRNKLSGLIYIGSSVDVKSRWREHRHALNHNSHASKKMQNSWNKHGEQSFEFVLLERCAPDSLIEREQWYLDTLAPFGHGGYNTRRVADSQLGVKRTDESKGKMCKAHLGVKLSESHRKAIGDGHRGIRPTVERIEAMRKQMLGNQFWLGKTHSEESRHKIGAFHRGRKRSPETRKKIGKAKEGNTYSLGRVVNAETRQKISRSLKGNTRRKGTQTSTEGRNNIRLGVLRSIARRKLMAVDPVMYQAQSPFM